MDIIRDQYKARLSSDFEGYGYQDALSLVMSAARKHERPLNEDEISGIIKEFLFAGHSTTSSAVTSLVMYLGKYPEVLDKLRKELEGESLLDVDTELSYEKLTGLVYLGDVINEVLRLSPPAGGGYRKTTQTMEIGVRCLFVVSCMNYINSYRHTPILDLNGFGLYSSQYLLINNSPIQIVWVIERSKRHFPLCAILGTIIT